MAKILIPRSDSISAKTIVPTDFEKYFENVIRDYVINGFTVTASSGVNRSVDVSSGTLRLKGMYLNNDTNETTAHTFSTDNTHYLYVLINRDGNGEPESWSYTSNTTGTVPTDSIMIAKVITSGGDVSSVDQSTEFKKMSHLHTFVGTGAEINALSPTYAGQKVFCISSGSGFTVNTSYTRKTANDGWITDNMDPIYGNGLDGDVTISSNTDLGSSNIKQYDNLTINTGVNLTMNSGGIIRVRGILTLNGNIHVNGKGGAGGAGGHTAGSGGAGGGLIKVMAASITGTGKIQANGSNGTNGATGTVNTAGSNGTIGVSDNGNNTAPDFGDGSPVSGSNQGGGGGGGAGHGAGGGGGYGGSGGTAGIYRDDYVLGNSYGGGGGGGATGSNGSGQAGKRVGGGGGGGAGVVILFCNNAISACTLEAIGGNGGNGVLDAFGGAGGGGGGGIIVTFTPSTDSSTKTVTGGTRGNDGGGSPGGSNGSVGKAYATRTR